MAASVTPNLGPYLEEFRSAKRVKTSQPRADRKCEFCRQRKRKCLPPQRDWINGEKCLECIGIGAPCGPNLRFDGTGEAPPPTSSPGSFILSQFSPEIHPQSPHRHTTGVPSILPKTFSSIQRGNSRAQVRLETPNQSEDQAIGSGASGISSSWQSLPLAEGNAQGGQAVTRPFTQHLAAPNLSTFDLASRVRQGYKLVCSRLNLYEYLLSRRLQIARAVPATPSRQFDDVDGAVDHHLALAYHDFANALASQFDNIRSLDVVKKDLFRRLLDYPRKFFHTSDGQGKAFDHHGKNVEQIYARTLQILIGICTSEGEQDEADELFLELARLPSFKTPTQDIRSQISRALERQSEGIHDAWAKLEVLPKKNTVATVKGNVFPSQNLAIYYGLDWYSPSQTSPRLSPHPGDTIRRGALHLAVEHSNRELVRDLASKHRDKIDDKDVLSMTPFLLSALVGDLEVLKILLKAGADPKRVDRSSRSALFIACEAGNHEIVRYLLQEEGCNPNEKNPLRYCTPLWAAASQGHIVTTEWLLKFGADPVERVQGKLPREIAEEHRHPKLVKLLTVAEKQRLHSAPSRSSTAASADPPSGRPSASLQGRGQSTIVDSPRMASQTRTESAHVASSPNPRQTKGAEHRTSPENQAPQVDQQITEAPGRTPGLSTLPSLSSWDDNDIMNFVFFGDESLEPAGYPISHPRDDGIG